MVRSEKIPFNVVREVRYYKAEDGGFWVEVVDLPGCFAWGNDIAEARKNIKAAARMWWHSAWRLMLTDTPAMSQWAARVGRSCAATDGDGDEETAALSEGFPDGGL